LSATRQQLSKWLSIWLTIWLSVCNGPLAVNSMSCVKYCFYFSETNFRRILRCCLQWAGDVWEGQHLV